MENNENQENGSLASKKEEVKKGFQGFWESAKVFLVELLDIREGTDRKETIEKIIDGIPVKSHTAWILIFSIVIASIGLNVSSTAVVIGAMLVSPLMGPILGIGLSIGINDIDTLKRSLVNLGVMVSLSVITSFLFFSLPIFQEATPEIIARTKPDVRDVLIAIAGGLALIVALSRHKEITNTIAGIAIATALMPPLCTAGYGLATANFGYFFGAMFLFTINAIFIALATFVIVKFLKFPMVKYINSLKRKRIAQFASIVAFVILSFSIYQFYLLFQENQFKEYSETFVEELTKKTGAGIIDHHVNYKKRNIKLVILGKNIENNELEIWKSKLMDYGLPNTTLTIQQDDETSKLLAKVNTIEDLYVKNQKLIVSKEETIQEKDQKIRELSEALNNLLQKQIPFVQLSKEAKINYNGLKRISFSNLIKTDFSTVDTVPVFNVQWYDTVPNTIQQQEQLQSWLKARLNLNSLKVVAE